MKPWWKSRLLWANFIAAILAVIESQTGEAMKLMGPSGYLIFTVAMAGINAILRFDTDKAIK